MTTFAVLMREPTGEIFWFWLAVVVAVGAMGAGPVLSAIFSACRKPSVRRFVIAFIVACIFSLTAGVANAYAIVIKCDWYDVLWWLCG